VESESAGANGEHGCVLQQFRAEVFRAACK